MPDFREISALVRSRVPLIAIETVEETKAVRLLERLAQEQDLPLFCWSAADGLSQLNFRYGPGDRIDSQLIDGHHSALDRKSGRREPQPVPETQIFQAALQHIDKQGATGIYLLLDPHPYFGEAVSVRLLREIAQDYPQRNRTVVLVSASLDLPAELARLSARMRLKLPDLPRIREMLKDEIALYSRESETKVRGDSIAANALVQQLVGLCEDDARRLLRSSVRDDGAISNDDVIRVLAVKKDLLGDGGLEVELPSDSLDRIGGMTRLKRWLSQRRPVFMGEIADPGLPAPKGMLLMGVQGAGKSAAAKAVAGSWRVPLARLDLSALYDKFQGETERKLRNALAAAEALAPVVLWIDEIEKAIASGSADTDGGLSRRVLGTLLTWMAERKSHVFVVATANVVEDLPPELVRKGRFDELFFIDLPTSEVRRAIFTIHLSQRGLAPAQFDLTALAATSEGFSGAEIEQAVVGARYESIAAHTPLNTALLLEELRRTRPLSVVMSEKVAALRSWAQARCVQAE